MSVTMLEKMGFVRPNVSYNVGEELMGFVRPNVSYNVGEDGLFIH